MKKQPPSFESKIIKWTLIGVVIVFCGVVATKSGMDYFSFFKK